MEVIEQLKRCKSFKEANLIVFGKEYRNGQNKQKLILQCFEKYNIDIENVIKENKHPIQYCLKCGKKIEEKHGHKRKFCSLSCAASYNNSLKKSETLPNTKENYIKKYGENKYKELLLKAKQYYRDNKEKISLYKKAYREIHLQDYKVYQQNYQPKYRKEYNETISGRAKKLANTYKSKDKKRGMDNDINSEFIENNIFTKSCIYCGETDFKLLGCDRIDNAKGHLKDNVVCACRQCNCEREYFKKSVEEFKKYKKILLLSEEIVNDVNN